MLKKILLGGLALLVAAVLLLPVIRGVETKTLDASARQATTGSFISTPVGTTHYESTGPIDGEPVLLVHGFASPYYVWDSVAPVLAAAGYRVIRYDLMGRGYSDRPDVTYDAAFLSRQITELLEGLSITQPINVVGYSMGGAVTAEFANTNPKRIKRVALIAPFNTAKDVGPLTWPIVGDWLAKVLLAPGMPGRQPLNFYKPEDFPDAADKFREQMTYKGFGRAIHSSFKTIISVDQSSQYRQLAASNKPLLLVWGEEDQVVPFAESGRVRQTLGSARFVAVSEAGHAPQTEQPTVVNAALLNWLQQ